MNKSLPYILGGLGVLVLALSFSQVQTFLKIPALSNTINMYIMTAGAVLVIICVFLLSKSSKPEQPKEVPIYEGTGKERKVVAIQRMGKK
jgi:low affinity Fe/Cu permease